MNRIDRNRLHLKNRPLFLDSTEAGGNGIAAVFRGSGPRFTHFPDITGFWDFLLSRARNGGADLIKESVRRR